MKPENPSWFEKVRPILSMTTFVVLVIGVGFLTLNFVLALIAKFSSGSI